MTCGQVVPGQKFTMPEQVPNPEIFLRMQGNLYRDYTVLAYM